MVRYIFYVIATTTSHPITAFPPISNTLRPIIRWSWPTSHTATYSVSIQRDNVSWAGHSTN